VGMSWLSDYTDARHAFLYSGSGPMQDLNDLISPDSGWTLCEAGGINDSGQIVGYGEIGGNTHAFNPYPRTIRLRPPRCGCCQSSRLRLAAAEVKSKSPIE
jgi:probable HAF family extracellular repeat protein